MRNVDQYEAGGAGMPGLLTGSRLYILVFIGYAMLAIMFFNRILAGFFYDHTSFLSVWQPWANVIDGNYLINPLLSDQTDAMIPRITKFFVHRSWWQPELAFGLPLFALQGGLFFPLRALFLVFETQTAITIGYLLSTTLSGFFMFVFLRDYRISVRHAFLGGILYMLAPRAIATVGTTIGGNILPFFPLYFLAIKKIVRQRFRGKLLFFSLIGMLLVLSGFPSIVAFVMYLGAAYFLALWVADRAAAQKGCFMIYCFGTLCGFAMSAFVLWPTVEFVRHVADVSYRQAYWARSIPGVYFLHLFNPYFTGNPALGTWHSGSNLNETALYMGIIPWLFVLPAIYLILRRRERDFYFFPLAALIIFLIVFDVAHIKSLLRYLPIFDKHPATRMAFFLPFFMIPPCMLAFDRIFADRSISATRTCVWLSLGALLVFVLSSISLYFSFDIISRSYYGSFSVIILILAIAVFAIVYGRESIASLTRKRWVAIPCLITITAITLWLFAMRSSGFQATSGWLNKLLVTYDASILILWSAVVVLTFYGLIKRPAAAPWSALAAIAFLDLFLYTGVYNTPTKRETFYPKTVETEFLQQHMHANERILAVDRSFLPNSHLVYGIPSIQARGLTSAHYKRMMQQIDSQYLARRGTAAYFRYDLDIESPLIDLFNVKYMLAGEAFDLNRQSVANQFRHNSVVGFVPDEAIVQMFRFEVDHAIDQLQIKTADFQIRSPLEIEASVWSGETRLGSDRQSIDPDGPRVAWLTFSLPVFLEAGRDHELRLSLRRRLATDESFHLFCVKHHNLFPQGELATCLEHEDLTFRMTRPRPASAIARWQKVHSGGIHLYENTSASRRGIFQVDRIEWIDGVEDYLARVDDDRFFSTAYLIREDHPQLDATDFPVSDGDKFEYLQYDDHRVRIRVRTQSDTFVKIPDTYYPGWTARANGERIKIYRTDLIFRGMRLPAGEYILEMQYVPRSVLYGGLIALLTFLTLIVIEVMISFIPRQPKKEG